jgi:hypothetical protein
MRSLAATLAVVLSGATVAIASGSPELLDTKAPVDGAWLLKQTAQRISLQQIGSGRFRLTLTGAAGEVRRLARGSRDATFQRLDDFVRSWHKYGFDVAAPHAAVVTSGGTLLLRLSRPRLVAHSSVSYLAEVDKGPPTPHLRLLAAHVHQPAGGVLGSGAVYIAQANTSPVLVKMGIGITIGWGGTFSLSSPVLQSLSGQNAPVSLSVSGSSLTLDLFAPTGNHPEQLGVFADPLGECVMVTYTPEDPYATITVEAAFGPILDLHNGLNGLPIRDEASCPDEPTTLGRGALMHGV